MPCLDVCPSCPTEVENGISGGLRKHTKNEVSHIRPSQAQPQYQRSNGSCDKPWKPESRVDFCLSNTRFAGQDTTAYPCFKIELSWTHVQVPVHQFQSEFQLWYGNTKYRLYLQFGTGIESRHHRHRSLYGIARHMPKWPHVCTGIVYL
jgi:hypothetical protein